MNRFIDNTTDIKPRPNEPEIVESTCILFIFVIYLFIIFDVKGS
jgi:hypothetical protein